MAICKECGANVPDDLKFCTECGKPMDGPVETAPPPANTPPPAGNTPPVNAADSPPPKGSPYTVISTGGYIFRMILFSIPLVGWIACVITAFGAKNKNKKNFARAMLVFLLIGIVVSAIAYALVRLFMGTVEGYIIEASGGAITDIEGFGELIKVLRNKN